MNFQLEEILTVIDHVKAADLALFEYQDMDVRIPEVSSESLYLDKVDVTVANGPENAMNTLDDAIAKLNDIRSRIGAFTNRLEYASNSLSETHEDMTNAYSGILDTDMAEEMT